MASGTKLTAKGGKEDVGSISAWLSLIVEQSVPESDYLNCRILKNKTPSLHLNGVYAQQLVAVIGSYFLPSLAKRAC